MPWARDNNAARLRMQHDNVTRQEIQGAACGRASELWRHRTRRQDTAQLRQHVRQLRPAVCPGAVRDGRVARRERRGAGGVGAPHGPRHRKPRLHIIDLPPPGPPQPS